MSGASKAPALRWGRRQPDPAHGWVAVVPRRWPGPAGFWIDLDGPRLQTGGAAAGGPALDLPAALEDTVYLPPVPSDRRAERDALARRCLDCGAPALVQLLPGEKPPAGASSVFDLAPALLANGTVPDLPAGAAVLWPLVAGLTDGPKVRDDALTKLAEAGVGAVHGIAVEVAPAERRTLASLGDDSLYDRLFHGSPPSERIFAAAVAAHDMAPFAARPASPEPLRASANRELSASLALLGDLWLRLGRSEARGQAFYAAARWVDGEARDLAAIQRDGNLGVVSWLDAESRAVVEEILVSGRSTLLEEVRLEYLDPKEIVER